MIRVVIIDDHALMRFGLSQLLEATGDIEIVGEAADGDEGVEVVARLLPDLVLMDLSMPGTGGNMATERLHATHPEIPVLVLTSFADRHSVLDALAVGASGYMLKDAHPAELIAAVRSAARGESPLAPKVAHNVITAWRDGSAGSGFTDREWDVLVLVGEGLPNKVIALRLGIVEKTVKAHLTSIFHTLGVTDRMQAARWLSLQGRSEALLQRRARLLAKEPPEQN